ncbi:hypothetical protein IT087_00075 [Candidatus Uhrbacteria bacterium]|nr:hypothetical protein [Candidatus Uhrbacteria bacterium]
MPDLSDGEWLPFEPGVDRTQTFNWTLAEGDGEKTVYVMFKGPYFDLTSPVQRATIRLDQANLCQTEQEHAHIVDLEGHIMPAQTNPLCVSDFAHATIEPFIVTSDGSSRGLRDLYVRTSIASDFTTTYGFETGDDFSYDDVVVRVERQDRVASIHLDPVTDLSVNEVKVRVDAADRGMLDEYLLWSRGVDVAPEIKTIDLGKYQELCETDLVPHPHPGDLFKSPSSDIYYFGRDRRRHVFPNQDVFRNWYPDGTPIRTIASYQLENIPIGNDVTFQPGSLVQIVGEAALYVVDVGRKLREILSKTFLAFLRTPPLSELIHQVNPSLVTNYLSGVPIISESEPLLTGFVVLPMSIDDLWPDAEDEQGALTYPLSVLDGRVEFEGTPYPTGEANVRFKIFDRDGRPLTAESLKLIAGKELHLMLVRDDLTDLIHVHPLEENGLWSANVDFPEEGHYYVFIDINPVEGMPVILRASLAVGEDPLQRQDLPLPEPTNAFFNNPYRLELVTKDLVVGEDQSVEFQLTMDGKPFAEIEKSFGAYGHIVVLHHENQNVYAHIHPLEFPVNGLLRFRIRFPYPGRYTIFGQLSAGGQYRTFPITVDVPSSR